jgi:hypothetical protein
MTKEQAVRDFEEIYVDLYLQKADYWTAQQAWSAYVDNLCKNGEITQKQYSTWSTPFEYGKHLKPTRKQLEKQLALSKLYGWR